MGAKFDSIALGHLEVDFVKNSLQVKAAFVNSATGKTHGWTTGVPAWTPDTLRKLEELRRAMERDLSSLHFDTEETNTTSGLSGGIGEFLASDEEDAPAI